MSGKGDKPRSCFSRRFKDNYDAIDWGNKKKEEKPEIKKEDKQNGTISRTNN